MRRASKARFMGDARVFPGGRVDAVDDSDLARRAVRWSGEPADLRWRAAALRELVEEADLSITLPAGASLSGRGEAIYRSAMATGSALDADRLAYLSNWVTPYGVPRRFDTRFYVVAVAAEASAAADSAEVFDAEWVTPAAALRAADEGEWLIEFPTRKHFELLSRFSDPGEVVDYARSQQQVERIEPRVVFEADGSWTILLPGDTGYEEAPAG